MQAVLLDFNGTLFPDTRFHMQAWRRFFQREKGLTLSDEEISRRCIGPGTFDIFRDFYGDALSPAAANELCERKERDYRAAVRARPENMRLRPGAEAFLNWLTAQGVPFALATASPRSNVEFYLEELGLKRWFAWPRIVYDDGRLPGKPDPAFYLEAARRLGVDPARCLVAEDSLTGVEAARRAGAGRIVLLRGTVGEDAIAAHREIFAAEADFCGFERYLLVADDGI